MFTIYFGVLIDLLLVLLVSISSVVFAESGVGSNKDLLKLLVLVASGQIDEDRSS